MILALAAWLACFGIPPRALHAQAISPLLVGNNLWRGERANPSTTPTAAVMNLAGEAGIRFIRIGGNEYDVNMPSDTALLTWVNRIRAIGAEPMIQISQYRSAAQAAATVQFINITSGANVTYWSIGNEPWLAANKTQDPDPTEAQIATSIEGYFKPIAAAMKGVDSSIKIFGVDSEDLQTGLHARLFGGANNIAGKVPGKSYYYCDGLSWHRYPQASGIDPALEGLADIHTRIVNARTLVDSVNLSQGRSGSEALLWAIGEFNSKNGTDVHTWGNGQMFAGVYGLAMKYGAISASPWSLQESNGNRGPTDFGLLDGTSLVPRPSYWHTRFTSLYFSGTYLEGTPSISSNTSDLLVYGAKDEARDQVSVMILNRGTSASRPYTLHLNNSATHTAAGATVLNVNASLPDSYNDAIPARGTHVIVFRRDSITRVSYDNTDFISGNPPQTLVTPRSPLTRVVDDFNNYTDLAQQGYWTQLHVGSGQASISNGKLSLRAADTAHASATLGSPVSPSYNFFNRGFAIRINGFEQGAASLANDFTQFRLSLNSVTNRSFGSDDAFTLRINPRNVRLGYKINQPGVQGELRAGTANTDASLLDISYTGILRGIGISLQPVALAGDVSTITYQIQLDGTSGRIFRSGSFTAARSEWGGSGDSSLVLESRRDSAVSGGSGSYARATIDAISCHPLVLDEFDNSFTTQTYWTSLYSPSNTPNSSIELTGGSATLAARADSFGAVAIAGTVMGDFNFFQQGYTLDLNDIALTSANLTSNQTYFRLSINSTAQRAFTTPDSLTLRLTPDTARFGFKVDQPSVDAELRTGTATSTSALFDIATPAPVTGIRLTLVPLAPAGAATPVLYAMRLVTAAGPIYRTGTFTADLSRWGAAGDSSLVLEARRNLGTAGTTASYVQAEIGSVRYTPIPDDFLDESPSFAAWSLRQFSIEERSSALISGPTAMPANDGVNNLLKYAFGLEAKVPAGPGLLPVIGAPPSFLHKEHSGATDISYRVEASADLVTWDVPIIETSRGTSVGGWVPVTSRADVPEENPRTFYRVRVSSPPEP